MSHFQFEGLGCMKISADSGPIKKSHPTVSDLVELKEMRLMLYPCMLLNSYTLDKTGIYKLIICVVIIHFLTKNAKPKLFSS